MSDTGEYGSPAGNDKRPDPNDRFALTRIYVDDSVSPGTRRFGRWVEPAIDMTDYDQYIVTEVDIMRPDLIAYKTLGDERLWWAIMLVNSIRAPLRIVAVGSETVLTPGLILKIPKLHNIVAAIKGTA